MEIMRKALTGIFFLLCSMTVLAKGGIVEKGETFLKPLQERDSVLIADQLYYGFELKGVEKGTVLGTPDIKDTLMYGVKVVSPFKLEQTGVRSQGPGYPDLVDYKGGLVITSFDEGRYYLPPLTLQSISTLGVVDTLVFTPQILNVTTIQVDTASFKPHAMKDIIRYPITFEEVLPWILWGLLAAGLLALAIWLIVRYRRRKKVELVVKDPPHIIALRELEKYRGNQMWVAEKQKAFYSGITDAVRCYILGRYGISAMEMTTAEIFKEMKGTDVPKPMQEELKELFETADFVKFAKFTVDDEYNAKALPAAVRFVTSTYQSELENSEPTSSECHPERSEGSVTPVEKEEV